MFAITSGNRYQVAEQGTSCETRLLAPLLTGAATLTAVPGAMLRTDSQKADIDGTSSPGR